MCLDTGPRFEPMTISTGGLFTPLIHSSAVRDGSPLGVAGYRSSWNLSDCKEIWMDYKKRTDKYENITN